jgi:hypothetical protein
MGTFQMVVCFTCRVSLNYFHLGMRWGGVGWGVQIFLDFGVPNSS